MRTKWRVLAGTMSTSVCGVQCAKRLEGLYHSQRAAIQETGEWSTERTICGYVALKKTIDLDWMEIDPVYVSSSVDRVATARALIGNLLQRISDNIHLFSFSSDPDIASAAEMNGFMRITRSTRSGILLYWASHLGVVERLPKTTSHVPGPWLLMR